MERSPSGVAGSASKYCMLPSGQLIGVLVASPRGFQVMTSNVPPVASTIAWPRVRIDALPGSPGPPQLTKTAPVRVPVAGIFVIASVIFSPSGAFQSFGTSIVVHWKPSPQSVQSSAGVGGAGGGATGGAAGSGAHAATVSARASTTATFTERKRGIGVPSPGAGPNGPHDLGGTGGGQWPWTRHGRGPGPPSGRSGSGRSALESWAVEEAPAESFRRRPAGSAVRPALVLLAAAAAALAVAVAFVAIAGPVEPAWYGTLFPAVGTAYVGSGLLAWYRRPANRVGPLLVAAGVVMYLAGSELTGTPVLIAIGLVFSLAPIAVILHLLLAFPTGRLTTRAARALAVAGYVVVVGTDVVRYSLTPGVPFAVGDVPAVVAAIGLTQRIGTIVIILGTSALLVHRFRLATPTQRRTLAPLYAFGILTIGYIVFAANVLPPLLGLDLSTVAATQVIAIGLIPFAFAVGVLRGGFARTAALEDLGLWLARGDRDPEAVRGAVAETLGDPDARLVFRIDDGYVDAGGNTAEPGPGRTTARVLLHGAEIGAIVHDSALVPDSAHVDAVCGTIAIALDRQRLVAELRASRARVTEAADAERRAIARDPHDGIQGRLVPP